MFLNLKYHIASLAAVFMALGLGILIGSIAMGNDTLLRQSQHLTLNLESQLELLRHKNESLQAKLWSMEAENNTQKQFEKQVFPVLVNNKLINRNIVIIETGGYSYSEELAGIMTSAGAEIKITTSIIKGFDIHHKDEIISKLKWDNIDENKLFEKAAREISRAILIGDHETLNILADEKILKFSGQGGFPVDDVIIIGGSRDKKIFKAESIDFHIIDFYKSRGINVYGVEQSSAAHSYIKEYQKKEITTVDNIDTIPGQISLIYAICGKPGQYGIKSSARKFLPTLDYEVWSDDI